MDKIITLLLSVFILNACAKVSPKKKVTKQNWLQATHAVTERSGSRVDNYFKPYFEKANTAYPPKKIALLAFKKEKKLELWAKNNKQQWQYIKDYPFTAQSGHLGPKLREFDKQIPEGIYKITGLNPFSSYYLSMMINYPNAFDKKQGRHDGRRKLGNNIFIHGKNSSVGCIAIGDKAINQLFVLVDKVGKNNTEVIIAPNDFRHQSVSTNLKRQPKWVPDLYQKISSKLQAFHKESSQA